MGQPGIHAKLFGFPRSRSAGTDWRISAFACRPGSTLNAPPSPAAFIHLWSTWCCQIPLARRPACDQSDRILKADGELTASGSTALARWRDLQDKKWKELATGNAEVSWSLLVETAGTGELRTVELRLPTRPPHWGATVWQAPNDRVPVTLSERSLLAERAETILNNGIWILLRGSYVRGFRLPLDAAHPNFLCYQWTLWSGSEGHRMYVSQQRGRTDIIFEVIAKEGIGVFSRDAPVAYPDRNFASATTVFAIDACAYLTSPSGVLEMAWRLPRNNQQQEIPIEAARAGFEREIDFWTERVGKSPGLWPLTLLDRTHAKER
jgi:hypothetical protein